jgi:hypothetical protein
MVQDEIEKAPTLIKIVLHKTRPKTMKLNHEIQRVLDHHESIRRSKFNLKTSSN